MISILLWMIVTSAKEGEDGKNLGEEGGRRNTNTGENTYAHIHRQNQRQKYANTNNPLLWMNMTAKEGEEGKDLGEEGGWRNTDENTDAHVHRQNQIQITLSFG